MTKGFGSKPMKNWAGWKQLEVIEVDPTDNSNATNAVAGALPEILKQCPNCISLAVPVDCMVACGRALGEARGVGAYSVVRELRTNSASYYSMINSTNWNQILSWFPEMDKFDSGYSKFDLLTAGAMSAPRILDLRIKIRVGPLKKEQIEEELQTKLTHLAQIFPGVQSLSIDIGGTGWRSQSDIRASPRETAVIDFSLLSMLPLKNLKVSIGSEKDRPMYDIKADSLSDMVSLQHLEVSGCSLKNEGEILKSSFPLFHMSVKIRPIEK
jgi:hypothetical protein